MSRICRAFPWHPTAIAVASTFVLVGVLGLAQEPPDAAFLGALRSGDVAAVAALLDRDPGALRRADAQGL